MQLKQVIGRGTDGTFRVIMQGCGHIVALFGPNGAGKTRMLHHVADLLQHGISSAKGRRGGKAHAESQLPQIREEYARRKAHLEKLLALPPDHYDRVGYVGSAERNVGYIAKTLKDFEKDIAQLDPVVDRWLDIGFSEFPKDPVKFVMLGLNAPTLLNHLREIGDYTEAVMSGSIETVSRVQSPDSVVAATIPFLHQMARASINQQNPRLKDDASIQRWVDLFVEAQRLISEMMRMKFDATVDKKGSIVPTLDGRPIALKEFRKVKRSCSSIRAIC